MCRQCAVLVHYALETGRWRAATLIRNSIAHLDAASRRRVLGENAVRVFGL